jgi:hypothetical protein
MEAREDGFVLAGHVLPRELFRMPHPGRVVHLVENVGVEDVSVTALSVQDVP